MPKRIIKKTSLTNEEILADLLAYTDQQDDCQIWRGAVNTDGYAHMFGNVKVHRLVYELVSGVKPTGYVVCHSCDVPLCINPDHLSLGTPADNMHHKFLRNRQPRVITKEIVFKVRELLNTTTMKNTEIAQQMGINPRRVADIKHGLYNEAGKLVRQGA